MQAAAQAVSVELRLPSLSLPGKIILPHIADTDSSMLGLGDIFVPSIMISHCLRLDIIHSSQGKHVKGFAKYPLFYACIAGYVIGLAMAIWASHHFDAAQPALLYLVPTVSIACIAAAVRFGSLHEFLNSVSADEEPDDLPK